MSHIRKAFTLIELLVVVAIIALLISILLPSLSKAREQAKAAICASRLKAFGQASALYEGEWKTFAPCDPWGNIPDSLPAPAAPRDPNAYAFKNKWDPAHGYLAMVGMGIKPEIPPAVAADERAWVAAPYGFAIQGAYADNPAEDLWQGFFCPSQNKRNTMSEQSPELNFADQQEGAPTRFKHGSGYMVNKLLRSPATNGRGTNLRYPSQVGSASSPAANPGALYDNVYSTPRVTVTATGTSSPQEYHIQAINSDEILNGADTAYMCDTQDYRIGNDTTDAKYDTYTPGLPAGRWMSMNDHSTTARKAVVLGARHNGKANVLYADSHVTRDNLVPRNRRGDLITATTFADWTSDREMGNVHHLMPTGRRF